MRCQLKSLPLTIKIVLEGELRELSREHFTHKCYMDGDYSWTKQGREKDKEEHQELYEQSKQNLFEAIDFCYPQFRGVKQYVETFNTKYYTFYFLIVENKR